MSMYNCYARFVQKSSSLPAKEFDRYERIVVIWSAPVTTDEMQCVVCRRQLLVYRTKRNVD